MYLKNQKIISIILIIACMFANSGFSVLANSFNVQVENELKEKSELKNYYEEYMSEYTSLLSAKGVNDVDEDIVMDEIIDDDTVKYNRSEESEENEISEESVKDEESIEDEESNLDNQKEEPEEEQDKTEKESTEEEKEEETEESKEETEEKREETKKLEEETTSETKEEAQNEKDIVATESESEVFEVEESEVATESEIKEEVNVATESETEDDKIDDIESTKSETDEIKINEDNTYGADIRNISTLSDVLVATYSIVDWEIVEVLLPDITQSKAFAKETDFEIMENRLAKTARVVIRNKEGREEIVRVKIKWKVKNRIDVNAQDRVDKTIDESYLLEEVRKRIGADDEEVSTVEILATTNEANVVKKIYDEISELVADTDIIIVEDKEAEVLYGKLIDMGYDSNKIINYNELNKSKEDEVYEEEIFESIESEKVESTASNIDENIENDKIVDEIEEVTFGKENNEGKLDFEVDEEIKEEFNETYETKEEESKKEDVAEEINVFDEDGNLIEDGQATGEKGEDIGAENTGTEVEVNRVYDYEDAAPGSLNLTKHDQLANYEISNIREFELDMDYLTENLLYVLENNIIYTEDGEEKSKEEKEEKYEEEKEENNGIVGFIKNLFSNNEVDYETEDMIDEEEYVYGYGNEIEEVKDPIVEENNASRLYSSEKLNIPKLQVASYVPAAITDHERTGHRACGESKDKECTHKDAMYIHQALQYSKYTPNDDIFKKNTMFSDTRTMPTYNVVKVNSIYLTGDTTVDAVWSLSFTKPYTSEESNVNVEVGYIENNQAGLGKSLNICLNGYNLNFGFNSTIQGVGRINICNCSATKESIITAENEGEISIREDGKVVSKYVYGRQNPCIRTTGMGVFGDIKVKDIINDALTGTGNSGPYIAECSAFYGWFKPTEIEKGEGEGEGGNVGFYIYDSKKKEIPLYYRIEIDGVDFENLSSRTGSGGAINAGNLSSVVIMNTTFTVCTASNAGGAICVNAQNCNFANVTFDRCSSRVAGGAIYAEYYGVYGAPYKYTYGSSHTEKQVTPVFDSTGKDINSFFCMEFKDNSAIGQPGEAGEERVGGRGGAIALLYVNSLTRFEQIEAVNNYANLSGGFMLWQDSSTSSDNKLTTMKTIMCDGNSSCYSGGTMAIVSQGEGDGHINILITGSKDEETGTIMNSTFNNTLVKGNMPAEIEYARNEDGTIKEKETVAGIKVPVYEKEYYEVMGQNYYMGSFGGAFYIEGCKMQVGENGVEGGKVEFINCYANDGGAIYVQQPRSAYFYNKIGDSVYKHYEYDWEVIEQNKYHSKEDQSVILDIPKYTSSGATASEAKYYYNSKLSEVVVTNAKFENCKTQDGDDKTIKNRLPISSDAPEVMGNYDEGDETKTVKYFTMRQYHTNTGGGCIYVGYKANVSVENDVSISKCVDPIYLCNGNIQLKNISTGSFAADNTGSYLFGYPSIADIENVITLDNVVITGCTLNKNSFSLTNAPDDNEKHVYTKLILKNKVVLEDNYKNVTDAEGTTTFVDMDLFLNLRTIECILDKSLDIDTHVGIYPDFKKDQLLFDYWDREHLKYYDGLVVSEIFYLNNATKEDSDFYNYRLYRDNEKIYIGQEWDEIHFDMDYPEKDHAGNMSLEVPSHFIYNKATGSIVSKPRKVFEKNLVNNEVIVRELNKEGDFIKGYSYVGWFGRDEQTKYKEEPFVGWEFEENKFRGSLYTGPDGSANDEYARRLFAVFTDNTLALKTCGTKLDEECDHADKNMKHYTHRGGATDSEAKLKNFVAVATFAQLYYTYEGNNSQYMLKNDVYMTDSDIPLKGNRVIYLNGYNIYMETDKPLFDFTDDRDMAYKEALTEDLSGSYDENFAGAIIGGTADKKGGIIWRNNNRQQEFINTDGKKIILKNVYLEGYKTTTDNKNISFINDNTEKDVKGNGGIFIEDSVIRDIKTYRGSLIEAHNLYMKGVTIEECVSSNVELTGETEVDYDLVSVKGWENAQTSQDIYIRESTFDNIVNAKNLFTANLNADAANKSTVVFDSISVTTCSPKEHLLNIINDNKNTTVVFKGENYIEENTLKSSYEVINFAGTKKDENHLHMNVEEGTTYIRYNHIEDGTTVVNNVRAALNMRNGNIRIGGHLEITDNYFDNYRTSTTIDDGHVNAGVYVGGEQSQIIMASGSFVVKDNKGFRNGAPVSSVDSKVYQIYVNASSNIRREKVLFPQEEGTKMCASKTQAYIHTKYADNNDYLIYDGWYETNVSDHNTTVDSLANNTFIIDEVKSSGDSRKVVKLYNLSETKIYISADFLTIHFMLYNSNRTSQEEIGLQYIKNGIANEPIETQLENPTKGERVFWEGPSKQFLTNNRNIVFHKDMEGATLTLLSAETKDFNMYGYQSDEHRHELAYGIDDTECDYWVDASKPEHFEVNDGNIFLRNDITIDKEMLATPVDKYSICLNGHTLKIANVEWFKETVNNNYDIYITDCKKTGAIQLVNGSGNVTKTPITIDENSLNISDVRIIDSNISVPVISVNQNGILRTRGVTFENVKLLSTDNEDRAGIFDINSSNKDYSINNMYLVGGATKSTSDHEFSIVNCTMGKNKSAIHIKNAKIATINEAYVYNNSAETSIFDIENCGEVYISKGLYQGNNITGNTNNVTGIFDITGATYTSLQDGAEFDSNVGGGNGAVINTTSRLVHIGRKLGVSELYDTKFTNNSVPSGKNGSVIYAGAYATVEINNALINNNFNAIYAAENSVLTLNNTVLTGNRGAYVVDYERGGGNVINFINTNITGNTFTEDVVVRTRTNVVKTILNLSGVVKYTENKKIINGRTEEFDLYLPDDDTVKVVVPEGHTLSENSRIGLLPIKADMKVFESWNKNRIDQFGEGARFEKMFYYDAAPSIMDYDALDYKLFRDGEEWISGPSYDEISYYTKNKYLDINKLDSTYIYKYTTGTLIDKPEITTNSYTSYNTSFVGFIGRSKNTTTGGDFKNWDFNTDLMVGSGVRNEYQYDRVLYAIFTDDNIKLKACGHTENEACSHDNEVSYVVRGGSESGSEEAKYKNYVSVSTTAQLFYKYNDEISTQYILENDLTVPDGLESITCQVLNLNGHNINVLNSKNAAFAIGNGKNNSGVSETEKTGFIVSGYGKVGTITGQSNIMYKKGLFTDTYNEGERDSIFMSNINIANFDTNKNPQDVNSMMLFEKNTVLENVDVSYMKTSTTLFKANDIKLKNVSFLNNEVQNGSIIEFVNGYKSSNTGISLNGDILIENNTVTITENIPEIKLVSKETAINVSLLSDSNFSLSNNKIINQYNFREGTEVRASMFYMKKGATSTIEFLSDVDFLDNSFEGFGDIANTYTSNMRIDSFARIDIGEIYLDIATPSAVGVSRNYGIEVDNYNTAYSLLSQKANTQLIASCSHISVGYINLPTTAEQLLYEGWYYQKVKGYNEGNFTANTVFTTVESPTNYIYKSGTQGNANVYIGAYSKIATLQIIERDDILGDVLYSTQYIKGGVETSIERVKNFDVINTLTRWSGPSRDGQETILYTNDIIKKGTEILIVTVPLGETRAIMGEVVGNHVHSPVIGIEGYDPVAYDSLRTRSDFGKNYAHYYLQTDVVIGASVDWMIPGDVHSLCLNGHTLTFRAGTNYLTATNKNIFITDCKGDGKIVFSGGSSTSNSPAFLLTGGNINISNVTFSGISKKFIEANDVDRINIVNVKITESGNTINQPAIINAKGVNVASISNIDIATNSNAVIGLESVNQLLMSDIKMRGNALTGTEALFVMDKIATGSITGGIYKGNSSSTSPIFYHIKNNSKINISNIEDFSENEGGGIYVVNSTVEMNNIKPKSNAIETGINGSIVTVGEQGDVKIKNSIINENKNPVYVRKNATLRMEKLEMNYNTGSYAFGYSIGEGNKIYIEDSDISFNEFRENLNLTLPVSNVEKTIIYVSGTVTMNMSERFTTAGNGTIDLYLPSDEHVIMRTPDGKKLNAASSIGILPIKADTKIYDTWDKDHVEEGANFENIFYYDSFRSMIDYANLKYRLFKDNSNIMSGPSYEEVKFYVEKTEANINVSISPIYIYKKSTGTLIDEPIVNAEEYTSRGYTFAGFVGRNETGEITTWDFSKNKMVGSEVRNNLPYDRTLYMVVTDDNVKLKACGLREDEACNHDSNTTHMVRGGNQSGSERAKYLNYVMVSTVAQLFYEYQADSEKYSTQYILKNDITISNGLSSITAQVINLNHNTIYVENETNTPFMPGSGSNNKLINDGVESYGFIVDSNDYSLPRGKIVGRSNLGYKKGIIGDDLSKGDREGIFIGNIDILSFDNQNLSQDVNGMINTIRDTYLENVKIGDIYSKCSILNTNTIYMKDVEIVGCITHNSHLINVVNNYSSKRIFAISNIVNIDENNVYSSGTTQNSLININANVDFRLLADSNIEITKNKIHARQRASSRDTENSAQLINLLQNANSDDQILGKISVIENGFYGFERFTTNHIRSIYIDNLSPITLGDVYINISDPVVDGLSIETASIGIGNYSMSRAIFKQKENTQLLANESVIDFDCYNLPSGTSQFVYGGWYHTNVKDYNAGLFTVEDVFKVVNNEEAVIYKSNRDNNSNVYIGRKANLGRIEFVEQDGEEGSNNVLKVQYVAPGIHTSFERIKEFNYGDDYDWTGPDTEGVETIIYEEDKIATNTNALYTKVNRGDVKYVKGDLNSLHVHELVVGSEEFNKEASFRGIKKAESINGSYEYVYLKKDIVVNDTGSLWGIANGRLGICLNGHKLIFSGGVNYLDDMNASIFITDCKGTGEISNVGSSTNIIPAMLVANGGVHISNINITNMTNPLIMGADIDKFSMINSKFINNNVSKINPIIDIDGVLSDATVKNIEISNNSSSIMRLDYVKDMVVSDINIHDNNLKEDAPIFIISEAKGSIKNIKFENNKKEIADSVNAAMLLIQGEASDIVIDGDNYINGNTLAGRGTIITINTGGKVEVKNVKASSNKGSGYMIKNLKDNISLSLNNIEFRDSEGQELYGIYSNDINSEGRASISEITFENNKMATMIHFTGSDKNVNNLTISGIKMLTNTIYDEYGLIMLNGGREVNINDIEIRNNKLFNASLIDILETSDIDMSNIKIENNTLTSNKAVPLVLNLTNSNNMVIDGIDVLGNNSIGGSDEGIISILGNSTEVSLKGNVNIEKNSFVNYGALYISGAALTANKNSSIILRDNIATGSYANAVYAVNAQMTLLGDKFEVAKNSGGELGAVYVKDTNFYAANKIYIKENKDRNNISSNLYLAGNSYIKKYETEKISMDSYIGITKEESKNNTMVFNGWGRENVEGYNKGDYYFPQALFYVDEKIEDRGWKIYRYGPEGFIYIGSNFVELKFLRYDMTEIDTEYIAKNVRTGTDKMTIDNSDSSAMWQGPIATDENRRDYWDMDKDSDEENEVLLSKSNYVRSLIHVHKDCGLFEGNSCNHLNGAVHSESSKYTSVYSVNDFDIANYDHFALFRDIDITSNTFGNSSKNLNICLNGHTMRFARGMNWLNLSSGQTMNICDCTKSGKIETSTTDLGGNSSLINVTNGRLNLYGITIKDFVTSGENGNIINVNERNAHLYAEDIVVENVRTIGGNVIMSANGNVNIKGAKFANCNTTSTNLLYGNINIYNSTFDNNTGFYAMVNGLGRIDGCKFTNNVTQDSDAAAVYSMGFEFTGHNEFEKNVVNGNSGRGGALFIDGGNTGKTVSLASMSFIENSAKDGGAIYVIGGVTLNLQEDIYMADNTNTIYNNSSKVNFVHVDDLYTEKTRAVKILGANGEYVLSSDVSTTTYYSLLSGRIVNTNADFTYIASANSNFSGYMFMTYGSNLFIDGETEGSGIFVTDDVHELFYSDSTHKINKNTRLRYYANKRDVKILDQLNVITNYGDDFKLKDIVTIDNKNREGAETPYSIYEYGGHAYMGFPRRNLTVKANGGYFVNPDTGAHYTEYTMEVEKYTPINDIIIPTRGKYAFVEYNTRLGKNVEGAMTVTSGMDYWSDEDETIYALWETEKYTVRFNKNNSRAVGTMSEIRVGIEEVFDMPKLGFNFPGVKLAYWQQDIKDSAGRVIGIATYSEFEKNIVGIGQVDEIVVLNAIWDIRVLDITYDKNTPLSPLGDGENVVTGDMPTQQVIIYEKKKFDASEYNLQGYIFRGWDTKKVGPEEAEDNDYIVPYGNNVDIPFEEVYGKSDNGKITLYAVWTRRIYNGYIHVNDARENMGSTYANFSEIGEGDTVITVPLKYDTVLKDLPIGERKGYKFGYYTRNRNVPVESKESYEDVINNTTVSRFTAPVNLYALWINEKYELKLNIRDGYWEDGSESKTFNVYFDELPFENENSVKPKNDNYKFDYWNKRDVDYKELIVSQEVYDKEKESNMLSGDVGYTYDGDMNLYAVYFPTRTNVVFDVNDSEATFEIDGVKSKLATYSIALNERMSESLEKFPTPTKSGHRISYWSLNKEDNGQDIIDENTIWKYISEYTKVYAHYVTGSYNIKYSPGKAGSEVEGVMEGENGIKFDEPHKISKTKYKWDKHTQVGWYINNPQLDENGNPYAIEIVGKQEKVTTLFGLDATVKNLTNVNDATVELVAAWDTFERVYYINFHQSTPSTPAAGAENIVKGEMKTQRASLIKSEVINENKFELEGYKFEHWVTASGRIIKDKEVIRPLVEEENETIDLYAVWSKKQYVWNYAFPRKTQEISTTSYIATYDTVITIPDVTFTNPVYEIWGWSLVEDNTDYATYEEAYPHIINEDNVKNIVCRGEGTLYPIMHKKFLEIIYVTDTGVELELEDMPGYIVPGLDVLIPVPERKDAEFDGWGESEYIPKVSSESQTSRYKGSFTIPAKSQEEIRNMDDITFVTYWLAGKYKIILNNNGRGKTPEGNTTYTIDARVDENVTLPRVFTRNVSSSYYLSSYNTESNGQGKSYSAGTVYTNIAKENETITLYAIWARASSGGGNTGGSSGGSNSANFTRPSTNTNNTINLPNNITIVGNLINSTGGSMPNIIQIGMGVGNVVEVVGAVRQTQPSVDVTLDPVSDVQWTRNPVTNKWQARSNKYGLLTNWNYIRYNNQANWYYFEPQTGDMVTGWISLNNKNYFLEPNNESGYMVKGYRQINGNTYLFAEDGNLLQANSPNMIAANTTYLSNAGGQANSNWEYDPNTNSWKYFDVSSTGARTYYTSGWFSLTTNGKSNWYLFDALGNMQTGWIENNGRYYYLSEKNDGNKGAMLTGWQVINGQNVYFGEDGLLVQGSPQGVIKVQKVLTNKDLASKVGANITALSNTVIWNNDQALNQLLGRMVYNGTAFSASFSINYNSQLMNELKTIIYRIKHYK